MRTIFLQWHLGVGDAVICNGMVRVLAKQYGEVILPAKPNNIKTVEWLFSDVPQVTVLKVKDDHEMIDSGYSRFFAVRLGIGVWSERGLRQPWAECLYEDAQVPFDCRWSEFKLPDTESGIPCCPELFIHEDVKRGYKITKVATSGFCYYPSPLMRMSEHYWPLRSAHEIHVIDSCFLALADSIETSAKRHVLHLYATAHDPYKKFGPPTLRKNWEILR